MAHNLVRVHSTYSLVDGMNHPSDLASYVKDNDISAYLPLTDYHNFFAYVKHYRACKAVGLNAVYGVDINLESCGNVVCLASNDSAFSVLRKLVSRAYKMNASRDELLVTVDELLEGAKNSGVVLFFSLRGVRQLKEKHLLNDITYGFEVYQLFDLYSDSVTNVDYSVPVIPTVDVYYKERDEYLAHERRIAIQESELISEFSSNIPKTSYFHTEEEFAKLLVDSGLKKYQDINSIYAKFDVNPRVDVVDLPIYPFTNGLSEDDFLKKQVYDSYDNVVEFLKSSNPNFVESVYEERIKEELDVFVNMGYSGYFLIVWDYIKWAKENEVPVGVGRGSGAGSFVAFLLDIVGLDPLKYDLLFERFLNKERVSLPDIDTDFCSERRKYVISYVVEKYGEEKASQICTFGTMSAKSVLADVGRVYDKKVTQITELVPNVPKITLKQAIDQVPKLAEFASSEEYKEIFKYSFALEGGVRAVGRHAGGVVISRKPIYEYSGLYYDAEGKSATMLDMNDAEAVGMVKFDFLALRNLSSVKNTIDELSGQGINIDINRIPLNDEKTFELLRSGLTQGTFQLFSAGMRSLIKRLKPESFDDIIALVALFRPGPLQSGMVDNFIDRKHGKELVCYPDKDYQHSLLESVLAPTYGIILYQEQVMQIAQVMSNYTLGEADLLRRAMGKKKPEEMQKQKSRFVEGAVKNGVERILAEQIFILVDKFSGYGFNKSHSAVYAFLAYQTVYLKAHFPSVYMAEVLTANCDKHDKLASLIFELGSYGVKLLSPNVNTSEVNFQAADDKTIAYGLKSIKGISSGVAKRIVDERKKGGPYTSLNEFVDRIGLESFNKPQWERLIYSGSMDDLADIESLLAFIEVNFGFEKTVGAVSTDIESREYNQKKLCGLSFKLIDMVGEFSKELMLAKATPVGDLDQIKDGTVLYCGGLVMGLRIITTKVTRLVATLRDSTGEVELIGWSDFLSKYEDTIKDGDLFIVEGRVGSFNDKKQITLGRVWDKDFVRRRLRLAP